MSKIFKYLIIFSLSLSWFYFINLNNAFAGPTQGIVDIASQYRRMNESVSQCGKKNASVGFVYREGLAYVSKMETQSRGCYMMLKGATYACLEKSYPAALETANKINLMAAAYDAQTILTGGVCDNKIGEIVHDVNLAFGVWQTACVAAKGLCLASCNLSIKAIDLLIQNTNKLDSVFKDTANVVNPNKIEILMNEKTPLLKEELHLSTVGPLNPISSARLLAVKAKIASIDTQIEVIVTSTHNCQQLFGSVASIKGKAEAEKTENPNKISITSDSNSADLLSAARTEGDKDGACKGFGLQAASMVAAAASYHYYEKELKKCGDKTNTPGAGNASNAVDCSKDENMQNPICVCKANPRNPACGGGGGGASGNDATGPLGIGRGVQIGGGGKAGLGGLSPNDEPGVGGESGNAESKTGTPGGAQGGGSGLSGSGGGDGGKAGNPGTGGSRKLNANILTGVGGGGGSSGGTSFRDADEPPAVKELRKHLPKLEARGLAGQSIFSGGEVTGKGKSNWDKIRERYKENQSQLMGN